MGKPRVILADGDENYIIPLEMKFLEELNDGIDLEIITDPDYFRELFSKPQNADILVVSNDMFSASLKKHNIKNLFLLSEFPDEEMSRRLDIPYIYKYSSLKEIYGKIMAVSSQTLNMKLGKPRECQIIMIYSAVGGVGKTLLSLGISACLSQNFKRVLYVNADRMNTYQFYLNSMNALPASVSMRTADSVDRLYPEIKPWILHEKFDLLPPFGAALSFLNIEYDFYRRFIQSAKKYSEYDVIIVDADVMLDSDKTRLAAAADKVFLITDQSGRSILATNFLMQNMNCKDNEKFYFICNKFQTDRLNVEEIREAEFIVDEYVKYIPGIETGNVFDLGMNIDIQRLSFLVE